MKLSKAIKIAIDAAMFILFVFLMGQHLTVDAHEWLGLAVIIGGMPCYKDGIPY